MVFQTRFAESHKLKSRKGKKGQAINGSGKSIRNRWRRSKNGATDGFDNDARLQQLLGETYRALKIIGR